MLPPDDAMRAVPSVRNKCWTEKVEWERRKRRTMFIEFEATGLKHGQKSLVETKNMKKMYSCMHTHTVTTHTNGVLGLTGESFKFHFEKSVENSEQTLLEAAS